jgi:predicted MFS family arabinose efflux permease
MQRPAAFALRYYAYRVTAAAGFTAPIWYLYLYANGLSYAEVAIVNSVWWTGLLVFELPTGYLGDRIGRRESLLIGTATVTLSTLAMIPADSVATFAVVFAVWAAGQTFRSGTGDAWLYDAIGGMERPGDGENQSGDSAVDASDGTDVTSDGTDVASDGTDVTSDGTDLASDGTDLASDGTDVTSDGTDVTSDGTDVTSDGTDVASDGTDVASGGTDVTSGESEGASDPTDAAATDAAATQDAVEARFLRLKSRGTAIALLTTGATALVGGWLAELSMAYTFLAAAAVAALGVPILATFPASRDPDDDRLGTFEALPVLREELGRPGVRSFVLVVGLLTGVTWGVNFFVQPVSVDLGVSRTGLGVLYAGFTGLGAVASYRATWIADRVGIDSWFRTVPVGLAVVLVAVAFVPVLAIPAFVAIRTVESASRPLAASWLNERIGSVGRATVLSAQGMVATALTVPFELGAGGVAELLGPLPTVGVFGGILALGTLVLLGVGRPFRRSADVETSPAAAGGVDGDSERVASDDPVAGESR